MRLERIFHYEVAREKNVSRLILVGFAFIDEFLPSGHTHAAVGNGFGQGYVGGVQKALHALSRRGDIVENRLAFHDNLCGTQRLQFVQPFFHCHFQITPAFGQLLHD